MNTNLLAVVAVIIVVILFTNPCLFRKTADRIKSVLGCICPAFRPKQKGTGSISHSENATNRASWRQGNMEAMSGDGGEKDKFELAASDYQQSIIDDLEPEVRENQKKYLDNYDYKKDPGATSRLISKAVINEPVPPDFIGLRRPTAVKINTGGGFQDLDIPEGALETSTRVRY